MLGHIVVTGASGRLGGQIAETLARQGKQVVATDRAPLPEVMKPLESLANFKFVQADLLDGPAVDAIIAHASAVIHVGAIPGPSKFPPPGIDPKFGTKEVAPIGLEDVTPGELLKQNLMGTFNVFESACKWGVKRVVFSSTAFTMGWSHDPTTFYPQYLPLDEAHPPLPCETYGLSKVCCENLAGMFARASPQTSFVSLRFTNIIKREKWAELPNQVPGAWERTLLMLSYTHEDDVLDVHYKALEADISGSESFLIAAPTTRFQESTEQVLAAAFPGRTFTFKTPLQGNAGIINADKARKMLGFNPRSWDDK